MGFLEGLDFDDVIEPKAVPEGEYELRVIEVTQNVNKNNEPYIMPRFEIASEPTAKEVSKYMALPINSMDEKRMNRTKLNLKRFFDAMGVDISGGVDLDALKGETVWAILGLEEDDEYGEQNFIKRFVQPGQ